MPENHTHDESGAVAYPVDEYTDLGTAVSGGGGGGSLPVPTTGDGGKVVTVSEAEDGYELDTPAGLRPLNMSEGEFGAFGVLRAATAQTITTGSHDVTFDGAYTLEGGYIVSAVAVDNTYMTWDPGVDATRLYVKQTGWYNLYIELDPDAPPTTGPIEFFPRVLTGQNFLSQQAAIPIGGDGASCLFLVYLTAGVDLHLRVANLDGASVVADYAALFLMPMFALA